MADPTRRTARWDRDEAVDRLAAEAFDVVVVGGGVTGAGVARDAALRGLRTALLEAADFAAGASSRTTKFAHGGLRYLETLDFALVKEALAERATLLSIAPHLTRATPFLIPFHAGRSRPSWKMSAGLALYDALAGKTRLGRHQTLDADGARAREPLLEPGGLGGAGVYWDARVRDARLAVETLADARRAGAVVANRCAVVGLEPWKIGWTATVEDRGGSRAAGDPPAAGPAAPTFEVRGRAWVNATGPWSDRLRAMAAPDRAPLLYPTKGVHVTVARETVPVRDPTALFAPDGRLIFAVPEGPWTYVGTTDTADHGAVDDHSVSDADVDYLVEAVDGALVAPVGTADVAGAWAGWRPLVAEDAEHPDAISREEVVEETAPGLWTVAGGKLTTYRLMAEETLDRIVEAVGWDAGPCVTAVRPLVPASVGGEGPPPGAPPSAVARARELFGPDADDVFARWRAEPPAARPLDDAFDFTPAEVARAALEMVGSLDDLVDRRLLSLPEGVPVAREVLERVAAIAGDVLGWDAARRAREVEAFRRGEDRRRSGADRARNDAE